MTLYNPQRERLTRRINKLTIARRNAKKRAESKQYRELAKQAKAAKAPHHIVDALLDAARIPRSR